MAYIFVDDGCPEAEDYASNYVWFDERDASSVSRAMKDRESQLHVIESAD